MENKEQQYYADIIAAMAERTIKRLWIALIVAILLIAGLVGSFLWYLQQYDFEAYTTEYSQDGQGLNVIGANSSILNGADFNGAETYGESDEAH